MVAIVDSGSTKSDWVILDDFKKVFLKTETIGFNPNFINRELIVPEIEVVPVTVKADPTILKVPAVMVRLLLTVVASAGV